MSNVILGLLLLGGPQTIYSLHKLFEQGISLFYRASLGGLRGALTGMIQRNEVVVFEQVENGRQKKYYRPTETGTKTFQQWLTSPITGSDFETAALAKLFFLGMLETQESRREVLDNILSALNQQNEELNQLSRKLEQITPTAEEHDIFTYQRAVLDYGIGAQHFALDYFTALLAKLD